MSAVSDDRAGCCRRCRGAFKRICLSPFLHHICHLIWVAIKLGIAVIFVAWAIGIPGKLLEGRFDHQVAPYTLTFQRITWNPLRGLIIHHPALTSTNIAAIPVIQTDAAVIRPDYRQLTRGHWVTLSVYIDNGEIFVPMRDATNPLVDVIAVRQFGGNIIVQEHDLDIAMTAVSDLGTRVSINGKVRLPTADSTSDVTRLEKIYHLHQAAYHAPIWLLKLRARMNNLHMDQPPQAAILFSVNYDFPQQNRATATFNAANFTYENRRLDGILIDADYTDGELNLHKVQIDDGNRRCVLSGRYQVRNDLFTAHAFSDLSSDLLLMMVPFSWRSQTDRLGLQLEGPMRAEAWIGPCSIAEVPSHWGGWISADNFQLQNFPIQKAFASFKRQGDMFTIDDGLLHGGRAPGSGPLTFSARTDYQQRTSTGAFDLGFDLSQLGEILPRGLLKATRMIKINDKPVRFTGTYHAPIDNWNGIVVKGKLRGTNALFRGVATTGFEAELHYAENVVRLDQLQITCPTGAVRGSLDLDLTRQVYGMDLEITTNPKVIAPMAGTNFARRFQPYRFSDEIRASVKGVVDVKFDQLTNLDVQINGNNIGINRMTFDRLSVQGRRMPGILTISNIVGHVDTGTVTGSLDVIYQPGADSFTLAIGARDISVDRIAAMLTGKATNKYEGVLTAHAHLAGRYPDAPAWTNLTGQGSFQVQEGRLMMIPLFGGLSSMLSALMPGLGFSEQNFMSATMEFRDGAIYSSDLSLQGSMLSVAARGYYHWSDGLNYYVTAHPFRDGSVASAVRLVTMPFSYLFQFKVTGPVNNPKWRPANLPL